MTGLKLPRVQIARQIKREIAPDPYLEFAMQWGVVSAIQAGPPMTVSAFIDASTTATVNLRCAGWYNPVVGDYVLVLRQGSDRVVMGTLAFNPGGGIPIGAMLDWPGGSTAPAGFLLCDTASYSYATGSKYIPLFTSLGGASSPWGVNVGAQTFQTPDYRGRVGLGSGTGPGLTARTVGQTGGEEANSHTHTSAAHSHTLSAGTAYAQLQMSASFLGINSVTVPSYTVNTDAVSFTGQAVSLARTGGVGVSGNTDSATPGATGTPTDTSNLPPFSVATRIIKY